MASFRIGRVAGIEIGLHWSWLVIFLLVTWSLSEAYFPVAVPDASTPVRWALGAIAALLLFASVLLHELAHSIVARSQGLEVHSITLFLFGGVSNLAAESARPLVEFLIAIVGPLTSFGVAALAFLAALLVPATSEVGAVLAYIALINLLLGVFNLVPGFPLDGGRVLRSIVWQVTGSLRRATEIAGSVGILVAYGLFIWGFLRVLGGDVLGGLWMAAIGWFLHAGATASVQQVRIEETLRHTLVGDIVRPDDTCVPPELSVDRLVEDYLLGLNRRSIPVAAGGAVIGMVTLGDVRDVPPEERADTTVEEVMGGRDGIEVVRPDDSLAGALETLGRGDYEQAPVMDGSRLVGVLTRGDIMRQFQLRRTLDISGPPGAPDRRRERESQRALSSGTRRG